MVFIVFFHKDKYVVFWDNGLIFYTKRKKIIMEDISESPPEFYHHIMLENRHIVFEIKLSLILILGCLAILACIIYIIMQCKRKQSTTMTFARNRCGSCDKRALLRHSHEAKKMLSHNEIIGETKQSKEFFVWENFQMESKRSSITLSSAVGSTIKY